MYQRSFVFGKIFKNDSITITKNDSYSSSTGYGFLTENVRQKNELLQIPEINNGFHLSPEYLDGVFPDDTAIMDDDIGCYLKDIKVLKNVPLTFKADVPKEGNYLVHLKITASHKGSDNIFLFSQCRRLMLKKRSMKPGQSFRIDFVVNACPIIPDSKAVSYSNNSINITLIGEHIALTELTIEETNVPTIYLAGNSTVTDQIGSYPYDPATCYCGWGQVLPAFLNSKVAVSNHAHSGFTTEAFRQKGHFQIILDRIKPKDFFFMQFGHNDQKLTHLAAFGGYADQLRRFIHEIKAKGAYPILVTPIARNTWNGGNGTYLDLLQEYADVCIKIGREEHIPVLDLHRDSLKSLTSHGLEASKVYFYPGDYTHTNDYGALKMAGYIVKEFQKIPALASFTKEKLIPHIPKNLQAPGPSSVSLAMGPIPTNYQDIDSCYNKNIIKLLGSLGILPNDEYFHPDEYLKRIEAIEMVSHTANYFITNDHNDHFHDIPIESTISGIACCACAYGIIDQALIRDNYFLPQKRVTYKELLSFCVNAYRSRYDNHSFVMQELADDSTPLEEELLRYEAVDMIYRLRKLMLR